MELLQFGREFLEAPFTAILIGGLNKRREQRMRLQRLRLEFRMKLASQEMRMAGDFYNLNIRPIRSRSGDAQPGPGQDGLILAVEFIAMTMALADFQLAISFVGKRTRFEFTRPRAQPHGAAEFVNSAQLAQFVDHPMRRGRVEFAGIRRLKSADIAGILDARRLHAQANSEIGNLVLPRIADSIQHSRDAPLAKAAGNQQAVIFL